jgi:hypothetical protein
MKQIAVLSLAVLTLSVVIAAPAPGAAAATLYARNNGVDTPGCGGTSAPCRTIGAAIQNAADGDRIVVGPGRYGDFNGDLVADPGEEPFQEDCNCLVHIDRQVSLESEDGAAATLIDAGGSPSTIIHIGADNVTFGRPGRGFTLLRGGAGLTTSHVRRALVSGNHVVHNAFGGILLSGIAHRVARNFAIGNGYRNIAVCCEAITLTDNVALRGEKGFDIEGIDHVISGNLASGNLAVGFMVAFGGHRFTGNSAIGNAGAGIWVFSPHSTFTGNNIYGNDPCGLRNQTGTSLVAAGNFWGAAEGPGASGADAVCNVGAGSTVTAPAAAREFPVKAVRVQ